LFIGSELVIWGIKETARQLDIYLADLQACLHSGQLRSSEYFFSKVQLSIELQKNWSPITISIDNFSSKNTEVWMNDSESFIFIEKLDQETHPRDEFNVPKTTMGRCLKHNIPYKGFLFSRKKLH